METKYIEVYFYSARALRQLLANDKSWTNCECNTCGRPIDAYDDNEYHEGYHWVAYRKSPRFGEYVCAGCFSKGVANNQITPRVQWDK